MKKKIIIFVGMLGIIGIFILNSFTYQPIPTDINYRILREEYGLPLCPPGQSRMYCMKTNNQQFCDTDDITPCEGPPE